MAIPSAKILSSVLASAICGLAPRMNKSMTRRSLLAIRVSRVMLRQSVRMIYSKQTDRYLSGTDGVTTWHDYVYYWMPFLDNKYGTYGLHDATWRASTDFGNISREFFAGLPRLRGNAIRSCGMAI